MKLASLHIICEYKKRAVAPGIRPSTSTLHYTLTTYGEKFLRTVENEPGSPVGFYLVTEGDRQYVANYDKQRCISRRVVTKFPACRAEKQ